MNLEEEKYSHLKLPLRDLRGFRKRFLENHSILKLLNPGVNTKDEDMIVRLQKANDKNSLIVFDGERNLVLEDCSTRMETGEIGKLRSVASVREVNGEFVVVKNNFTSLIRLPMFSFDAQTLVNRENAMDIETGVGTSLNDLVSMPISSSFVTQNNV